MDRPSVRSSRKVSMQMGQPDTVPGDVAAEAGNPEEGEGEAGKVAAEAAAAAMSRLLKCRKQRGPKLH
jgi:hypothetical protein